MDNESVWILSLSLLALKFRHAIKLAATCLWNSSRWWKNQAQRKLKFHLHRLSANIKNSTVWIFPNTSTSVSVNNLHLWWISKLFRDLWLLSFISAQGSGGLDHSYGSSSPFLTLASTSGWIYEHRYLQHRSSWRDWEWYLSKPSPLLLSAQSKMEPGGIWRETTADSKTWWNYIR